MKFKGKRLLVAIMMMAVTLCLVVGQKESYAMTTGSFWVNLAETRTDTAYAIGNPTGGQGGKRIWDLVSYDTGTSSTKTNKNLYCVKGGFGTTWNNQDSGTTTGTNTRVNYTQGYNLKTEKSEIEALSERSANYSNIAGTYYKQILCIIDNMYVPGQSTAADRTALLKAAEIDYDDEYGDFYGISDDKKISDDDIEVVQQLALWYYTNYGDEIYSYAETDKDMFNQAMNIKNSVTVNQNWQTLATVHQSGDKYGPIKAAQMEALFDYLIRTATNNADKYITTTVDDTTTTALKEPITVEQTNLTATLNGDYYKVGPINITKNNNLPYTLSFTVKNSSGTISSNNVSYVNQNDTAIDINNLSFTDNKTTVYVKVPKSAGDKISIDISAKYSTSNGMLWVPGTNNVEQPIVEVTKVPGEYKVSLTTEVPETKPFDLSLRKFITKINNDNYTTGEDSRVPQLGTWTLDGNTTITKTHPKTKLPVEKGDIVLYTIRIYNEGEIDGQATKITDYLPEGLEFIPTTESTINADNGWTNPSGDGKTLVTEKLKGVTIDAFNGTTVDFEDVQIECKVIATKSSQSLKNIAEITDDYNAEDADDRDSQPGNVHTNGYTPEAPTTGKGEQDDDDFEDLLLKKFDLSLRKFISAVSDDATIEKEDELKDSDSREPEVTGAWRTDETTTLVKNPTIKDPLTVKTGDYILYTIRVYNEGEVDGYASEIKDKIPDGLEFVKDDTKYNGIWTIASTRTNAAGEVVADTITTNWLARDNDKNKLNGVLNEDLAKKDLIKALKKDANGNVTVSTTDPLNPDYRDVQVLLKVTEDNSSARTLTNYAQISKHSNKYGDKDITDRDSTPDNGFTNGEDDDDYEPVVLQTFDLALRKFIVAVSSDETLEDGEYLTDTGKANGEYTRAPIGEDIDTSLLNTKDKDGNTITTATYNHTKEPLKVKRNDYIVYNLRVYNEGSTDGYALEVTDCLPSYLEFVDNDFNKTYGWKMYDKDGNATEKVSEAVTLKTEHLKDNRISKTTTKDGKIVVSNNSKELLIMCKVKDSAIDSSATSKQYITNIAEISKYGNEKGQEVQTDRDSTSNNVNRTDGNKPDYKDTEIARGDKYIPGQQDDDDFEKVYIEDDPMPEGKFDLALRKFITQINGKDVDSRVPDVDTTTPWGYDNGTTTKKNHSKTPLAVVTNDTVTYTIRVYNEGTVEGTATEITDYLPDGLQYIDNEFNKNNGWKLYDKDGNETTDVTKAVIIKTDKLSGENIAPIDGRNYIESQESTEGVQPYRIDHKDVQIQCKVVATANNGHNLRNLASITADNGDDIDSDPTKNPSNDKYNPTDGGTTGKGEEDDDDFEDLYMPNFDLALLKYVSQVIVTEDGTTKTTNTGNTGAATDIIPKVEVNRKKINSTVVKFGYTIKITNEGDLEGYAKEITDYVPEGLKFLGEDNPNWTVKSDGVIATRALEKTLLKPGESATVTVIFTWINGSSNLGLKTNTAEISEDYNEKGVPDKDSTPGNKVAGEDDIDTADVLLSIKTGKAQTYFILGGAVLITLASGIAIIRKFVL